MNVFKALFSGEKGFKEPFASTLLGYLFSPDMDHGLGSVFLQKFISSLKVGEGEEVISALGGASLMEDFDSNKKANVKVSLEYNVNKGTGDSAGKCDIVILIETGNKKIAFLIENKIRNGSVGDIVAQINGYQEGIEKNIENHEQFKNAIFKKVCIVPDDGGIEKYKEDNPEICWTYWNSKSDKTDGCIKSMLQDLLKDSSLGEISPLPSDTEYLLKSFIHFIKEDFTGYSFKTKSHKNAQESYCNLYDFISDMNEDNNEEEINKAIELINKIYSVTDNPENDCGPDGPIIYLKAKSGGEGWPFKIKKNGNVSIQIHVKQLHLKNNHNDIKNMLAENTFFKNALGNTFTFNFNLLLEEENLQHFIDVIERLKKL